MGVANAHIFEFFQEIFLAYFLFFVIMTQHFVVYLSLFFLVAYQRIGVILQRNEFVLVELFLLNIVESNNMFQFEILQNNWFDIGFLKVLNVSGATCKIVENIADLQIM